MCKDIPGQPVRRRIAVCACNQDFPICDLEDAVKHITTDSSSAHKWVWIDPEFKHLFPVVYILPDRTIHDYN